MPPSYGISLSSRTIVPHRIADADLHHIMKMQVINLVTVILHPLFSQVPAPDIFPALHKSGTPFSSFFFLLIQPPPRNSNSIIPCTVFSYKQTCRTCHSSVPFVCMETKNCRKSFSFKISFDSFLSSDRIFYHASFSESSPEIPAARLLCRKSHARFRPRRRSSFLPPPDTSCRCPGTDPSPDKNVIYFCLTVMLS